MGQKLTDDVAIHIPAMIIRVMAQSPLITFVKYKMATTIAEVILTALSSFPMFFLIIGLFLFAQNWLVTRWLSVILVTNL